MESKKIYKYINKPIRRIESKSIAMGHPVYMEDQLPKGCQFVKLVDSPYPNAIVEEFDAEEAKKLPGVTAIFTWEDTTNMCTTGWFYSPYEHTLLKKHPLYEGDPVAMIVAESERIAEQALKLIKIKWKVEEPLMDYTEAFDNDIVVHRDTLDTIVRQQDGREVDTYVEYWPEKNQIIRAVYDIGDEKAATEKCDVISTTHIHTSQQMHSMLETHRCMAFFDERDNLVLKGPMQAIFEIQGAVARVLGIDKRRIQCINMQVGGGFGGKDVLNIYMYAGFAAYMTRKPCACIMTRTESMIATGTRHEYDLDMTMGADKDGTIHLLKSDGLVNGGAYAELTMEVMSTGIHNTYPIFPRIDYMYINHLGVNTNKVMGCAFRGFGATQNTFAVNCAVRHLAADLGMDLAELMIKNAARVGDSHPIMNGYMDSDPTIIGSSKIKECIEAVCEMIDWKNKRNKTVPEGNIVRGVGIGLGAHASGVPRDDRGNVNVSLNADGSFSIYTGHCDIGTGSNTAMIQVVAETLDVPLEMVAIQKADTRFTPFDNGTYASSNAYRCCGAAKNAADIMKKELLSKAREYLKMSEDEDLYFADEKFIDSTGAVRMTITQLAGKITSYWDGQAQIVACGTFPDHFAPSPYVASCAEVEIDKETGYYRVLRIVTAVDAGQILNSATARVQIHGGIAQSLGMAMFEEVKYSSSGAILTKDYETYKIPSQKDMPEMEVVFADDYEPTGPFGAKSLGEVATGTPGPAICDAIFNATGVHIDSLPITPERLWRALNQ